MKDFKVRCVSGNGYYFVKGEVYNVENGVLVDKRGEIFTTKRVYSVEEINRICIPQFELAKEQFTKSDLKDGMVVTYRKGDKRFIINGTFYHYELMSATGNDLTDYNDDLTCQTCSSNLEDIIKVEYMGETIWQIKEKEYFTLEEAYKTGKVFRHKSGNWWYIDAKEVLTHAMDYTGKDMFEVLKLKEFEINESCDR